MVRTARSRPVTPPAAARALLVAGLVSVAALTGCGTGSGSGQAASATSATGDPGGPAAPTTDDVTLVTVAVPSLTVADMAAMTATPSATVVVGEGLTSVVTGQACGLPGVRTPGYSVRAHGAFCLVDVEVTNTSDVPQRFDPDRVLLLDGVDAVAPSPDALVLVPLAAMDTEVPAATTLAGSLVYDVPAGAPDTADRELRFDGAGSVALGDVGPAGQTPPSP